LHPAEEIIFRHEEGETTGMLTVTNTSDCKVAYKVRFTISILFVENFKSNFEFLQIKTTSPDKYRVRPSAGVINVGGVLNVTVHIQ